jgi:MYXO-CTERM domain-containing protein
MAWARPAAACTCAETPFEAQRESAVAIFEARVTAIDVDTEHGASRVQLSVVQTWREAEHEHVTVVTASMESACGFSFEVGRSYLVYASSIEADGAYRVSLCSRTRPMESADDDRALLGSGVVPVDIVDDPDHPTEPRPPSAPATHAGCASCSVADRGGERLTLLGLALAALAIVRRSRK